MFKQILTDSRNHDPNKFVYLVHAINDGYKWKYIREVAEKKIKLIQKKGSFYSASLIGKLDPKAASEILGYKYHAWKTAMHDQVWQTATNGSTGFILDIANDGVIYLACNHDINSPIRITRRS